MAFTPNPASLSGIGPGDYVNVLWTSPIRPATRRHAWNQAGTAWVLTSGSGGSGSVGKQGPPGPRGQDGGATKVFLITTPGGGGSGITALTGDVTASGSGSVAATIVAAAVTLAKIQNASANSRWIGSGSGGSGSAYTQNTFGAGLAVGATSVALSTPALTRAIQATVNGGGSVPSTGIFADVYVPYACTITAATMLADQSGSAVIDVWVSSSLGTTPTVANTITASDLPTLSTAIQSTDTTLTGWTTSVSAGSWVRLKLNSVTTCTRVQLTLTVTVT